MRTSPGSLAFETRKRPAAAAAAVQHEGNSEKRPCRVKRERGSNASETIPTAHGSSTADEKNPIKQDNKHHMAVKTAPLQSAQQQKPAATTSKVASLQNSHDDDDERDNDVELQQENSAWDVLGERFTEAAASGRYIDLTEHNNATTGTGGSTLTAAAAQTNFLALRAPVNPSTIVQPVRAAAAATSPQDPALDPLWGMVSTAVKKVTATRTKLVHAASKQRSIMDTTKHLQHSCDYARLLTPMLNDINISMNSIAKFVDANIELVSRSDLALRRVQELNQLTHKANVFVHQLNQGRGISSNRQAGSTGRGRRRRR